MKTTQRFFLDDQQYRLDETAVATLRSGEEFLLNTSRPWTISPRTVVKILAIFISLQFVFSDQIFAQKKRHKSTPGYPQDTTTHARTGIASWYGNEPYGTQTASGEKFSSKKFTCASNFYKMGTWLRVTNLSNGKSVVVKVNDRMAPHMKRVVDLTHAAAKKLDMIVAGVIKVKVEVLGKNHLEEQDEKK